MAKQPFITDGGDRHPNKRLRAGDGRPPNPEKCGAKTRKSGSDQYPGEPGRPCGQPAGAGTPNSSGPCYLHGGRGAVMVMAARLDAEKAASYELEKLNLWGARRDISPIEALGEELERTAGRVAAIEQRLAFLTENQQDSAKARGLAAELTAERGQLQRVAEAAARAGVPERRAELKQDQALQVAGLIRAVLGDLELTPAQEAAVPDLMRWHFAALGGQAVGPRPARPSQLPPDSYFDLDEERRRHAESQSGEPTPAPPPATPAPDEGQLIELRSVLARRDSHDERN